MKARRKPIFNQFVGIDYSGAKTPTSSLKGLRVYMAGPHSEPTEVLPPPGPKKYWTRRGVAEWLVEALSKNQATLAGIDHGFSFPLRYFEIHHLPPDWPTFLDDFHRHWPTDDEHMYVDFVRDGIHGDGAARSGNSRWRRLCDERAGAKSVFHFDVPGSVAKSTHAGLPWLRYIRNNLGKQVHLWPFDGWEIPTGKSVIAESYPSLFSPDFPRQDRTSDQHDAYSIVSWMQRIAHDGTFAEYFAPPLAPSEKAISQVEGWILGLK